ncbi:Glu/Leu/Phe/Val dehydrogenase family protein [Sansalvadorimonas verongulae]|uniref:Glu/Leu/Phe/Val dehydrogenase family protein n=1 Tax=Sansalvadorimonas verongulae TaxID=2172824 RepID=UPI0012BD11C5|nr:Glu/Leu/Phe/Val dehydrogenase dimerization domain-containing protein [Sansalvadorimonas verongulae]MTI13573.1 Glu/Leu/Phe/Val dehydrogenase [Sansalvadorimonas verongulae]
MFAEMKNTRTSELHLWADEATGLQAVIAINSTTRGAALGGCRLFSYKSTDDAIHDAIRLARGMSYKAALAGVEQGGGKAVIMAPREIHDREALFKAFGRFVHSLGGRYIAAMDVGTQTSDMDTIASITPHVACTSKGGDPAPYTALGVFNSIKTTLQASSALPDDISGARIAVQGLGNVGFALCELLSNAGAELVVSDIDSAKVTRCEQVFGARSVPPSAILSVECDVFSPCGMGGIIQADTVKDLSCRAVVGSANNQLATPEAGLALHRQGILYAPDYLVNAGGLIHASLSHRGKTPAEINERIHGVAETLSQIFKRHKTSGEPVSLIADRMAEHILYGPAPLQRSA